MWLRRSDWGNPASKHHHAPRHASCVFTPRVCIHSDGMQLLVEAAELPRGTFAKLQPLSEEFATLEVRQPRLPTPRMSKPLSGE